MGCFSASSNFVVSLGGVGGFSGGASGRVMRGHRVGSTKRFVVLFLIALDGSDFIWWPTKFSIPDFFFSIFFFFFFFQLQLCLSKRNIRSAKNTASRADGAALVGIERLTFRFGGSGMTIGPKSSFSSCSVWLKGRRGGQWCWGHRCVGRPLCHSFGRP